MILFLIKILISIALGNSSATSYTSLGLAQKGITKEAFLAYSQKSCETYKDDCDMSQDRTSIQQLQGQCNTDGIACFRLGLLLRPTVVVEGKSIPSQTSYDDAIMYFQRSCDFGNSRGLYISCITTKRPIFHKRAMSQKENPFSCREHYIKKVLDPQSSEQAQTELSNLCTDKDYVFIMEI